MIQLAKITLWEGNRQDWNCGKSTSKTQPYPWTSALKCARKIPSRVDFWLKVLAKIHANCSGLRLGGLSFFFFAKDVGKTVLGMPSGITLTPWDSVRLRTTSTHWNVPGKCGPHGKLFFFLVKKEPVVASNEVLPNLFVSAETLKVCALVGVHLLAAVGGAGSCGSPSFDLGHMWRYGCPESPDWDGDGESWSESCEGCLVVGSDHGPQAEVAQGVGPGPLVEL